MGDTLKCPHAKHARVALVGRASEVLECARAFKRRRIQFKRPRMRARLNDDVFMRARLNDDVFRISIDYILELLARFARSPINIPDFRLCYPCKCLARYARSPINKHPRFFHFYPCKCLACSPTSGALE